VSLATLTGVIFLIPIIVTGEIGLINKPLSRVDVSVVKRRRREKILDIIIPSFAAGALLATVVFLTVPESIILILSGVMGKKEEAAEEEGHEDHGFEILPSATWRFGAALLGGFLLPILFSVLFPHETDRRSPEDDCCEPAYPANALDEFVVEEKKYDEVADKIVPSPLVIEKVSSTKQDIEGGVSPANEDVEVESTEHHSDCSHGEEEIIRKNWSLALSILLGDALHNFCDGVFAGVAFMLCDNATAFTIISVTLYHEIAQEIADFFILTRHCGFSPLHALILNFLAGLSVVLGGILVLAVDMSDMSIGVLLALASGVYLYVAACEYLPRVNAVLSTAKDRILLLFMFIIGAIPVGLTLLNHSHCEAH